MAKDQDIIKAVKDNDKATLQKLLHKVSKQGKNKIIGNKKLNVNFQDAEGMSALHQAALMSSFQMLQLLLDSGATPGLRDSKGMTALHYSAWQGVPHPVQILLHKGSPVNEQALNGDIPLHLACQHGHLDVTSLLLNHQADPTICNKDLRTSLDLACQFGHTKVVELLLHSNLCQKLLEDSPTDLLDSSRTTCLHLAAKNGHIEIIKLLLQAGMNINRSTQKGTCLHEATLAGKTDVVHFLLDWGADVNKPNARDQTALDTVQKLGSCDSSKELIHLLKEASCAQYARAVKDHSNAYDSGSLEFREGDIITVLEQRPDGIWRGYLYREGRMAKTGLFPAHHVMLVDSKMVVGQQGSIKTGRLHGQVPDLLTRGPSYCSSHSSSSQPCGSSDCGSMESSSTDEATAYSFPPTPSSVFPPPPSAMLASYPPRGPISRDFSGADSGFSSLHSLPQPSSPGAHQQFGKCHFAFGPTLSASNNNPYGHPPSGCAQEHQLKRHQQNHGEGSPAPTSLPPLGGVCGDMRGSSPAKDSPGHSNRNSAASSDSGRGCSTGHADVKSGHNYVNVQVSTQQNRLSGQSSESGVSSSRQSYHSSSSSSHGSLDPLEEPGFTSTINVTQLFQAGVPDNEVLHAWLHDLHFEEYYPLFVQAGYDLPTISRMTPEDLTAVGITKPAHRKRLKAEIARLNIPDGIPDYRPNDLMEWLHLLGLGDYLDTLCGQGYDSINYVTDITWEDLEDIGIRKLGHQKKIMLAIDRLKRITSGVKHLSLVDGRTASLELLEPPPPAPPITGRWSDGEATAIPMHVYDGARPKKSPSGDSISTTGSGTSGSSAGSGTQSCAGGSTGAGGDIKVISLPLDDVGLAGAIPYRHSSTGSTSGSLQPDIITVQVRKNVRSCASDDKKESTNGQQLMYHSFQGSPGKVSDSEMFLENYGSRSFDVGGSGYSVTGVGVDDRHKPVAKVIGKTETESHEKEVHGESSKICTNIYAQKYGINNNINNNVNLGVDTREHIYDTPQISQSPKAPKPSDMSKPSSSFLGMAGPLHVSTTSDSSFPGQTNLSPGGKSGKKVPPPPPVRTHSIRTETVADRTPGSPVKTPVAPTVVTASPVHQHPTSVITPKQHPPPVMQKPQKPQKPTPAASQPHFQYDVRQQQQQPPLSPLVSQKARSPNPQKVIILPTTSPHLHSPTPGQGTPQIPVFTKPQNTPQQHLQPKSPLLTKVPLAAMVTSVPKQQQQLPHHQPLTQPIHKAHPTSTPQSLGIPQQPRSQIAVSPPHHFVPTSSLPGHSDEPQVKAFANCVKSLSEKFGKNTQEDDQFPDNVSTDSDDFPPPPPPIAMDIITPKIHNYGIPSSRDRRKPEFGLKHHRDYTHKSKPNTACALSCSPVKGAHLEMAQKNVNQVHHAQPSMVVAHAKILPEHLAAVHLRKQPPVSSSSSHSSPGAEHEFTPEPDSMNTISKEKRSESTSSFESNSSSSSIDSNTLPFANENVGTIKQRIVTGKPTGGQTFDQENGHRTLEQNSDVFDRGIHRNGAGYSDSYCSSASPSLHSRNRSSSMSESSNSSVYSSDLHHQQRTHQRQLSNPSFSGALQPPVPSKKPALSPKPSRSTIEQASLLSSSSSSPASEMSQKQEPITVEVQPQMGNVLSDIDNMLQGLTDELDAMLEEEMAS